MLSSMLVDYHLTDSREQRLILRRLAIQYRSSGGQSAECTNVAAEGPRQGHLTRSFSRHRRSNLVDISVFQHVQIQRSGKLPVSGTSS